MECLSIKVNSRFKLQVRKENQCKVFFFLMSYPIPNYKINCQYIRKKNFSFKIFEYQPLSMKLIDPNFRKLCFILRSLDLGKTNHKTNSINDQRQGICGYFFIVFLFSHSQVVMKSSSNGTYFSFKKRYCVKNHDMSDIW